MRTTYNLTQYRKLLIAIIATGNLFSAHAEISISAFLQNLTTRMEEIATAPELQSNDIYVLEEYLNVMLIQNPEIREISRIQPDGTFLKTAVSNGTPAPSGSVINAPWFVAVCLTKGPYCDLIRDNQGATLLFRAWPYLEPGAGKKLLGITTLKVDLTKSIQSVSENTNEPLEVLYNGTSVFKRNWTDMHDFLEDSFTFSPSDKFVVRYKANQKSPAPVPEPPKEKTMATPSQAEVYPAAPDINAVPRVSRETNTFSLEPEQKKIPEIPTASAVTGNKQNDSAAPVVDKTIPQSSARISKLKPTAKRTIEETSKSTFQSWLSTDSILTSGYVSSLDRRVILFLLLVAGLGFVMVFIITTIMVRRKRRQRREEKEREAMFNPDPFPSIMVDKDTKIIEKEETTLTEEETRVMEKEEAVVMEKEETSAMEKEETAVMDDEDTRPIETIPAVRPVYSGNTPNNASHAERETRELPALGEFIDEFIKKLHKVSREKNINQRNRIFEELNDDLNVWTRSEVRQLSGRIGLFLQAIKQCESKDGNSAELQVLRYEVMKVIKEVEDVVERLPQRNSVLIVN